MVNGHHDAIADLQTRVVLADLDDLAHELVAEHVALLHRRDVAVVDVQIGSADRRRRHFDDGVARIEDDRVGNGLDLDLLFAFPADGSHGRSYACRRRSRNLAGFEQLLEVPQILADGLRRLATEERRDERASLPCRRRVLQVHADLRAPAAARRVEVHRPGGDDVGSRKRAPREQLVLDLVDDLGVPLDGQPGRTRGDPVRCAVRRFRHPVEVRHEPRQILEATPERVDVGDRDLQVESIREHARRARRRARSSCCRART